MRRNYHGGVYSKAHSVRRAYIAAFDRALAKFDVLAMLALRNIAPQVEAPSAAVAEAIEATPMAPMGHTALPLAS